MKEILYLLLLDIEKNRREFKDTVLRELFDRLNYLRNLKGRQEEVIRLIEEQGKLTEDLKMDILKSDTLQRVEDLYRPYRPKKKD